MVEFRQGPPLSLPSSHSLFNSLNLVIRYLEFCFRKDAKFWIET